MQLTRNARYGHGLLADQLLLEWEAAQRPPIDDGYLLARRSFASRLYLLCLYPYDAGWEPLPEAAIRAALLPATQLSIGQGLAVSAQRAPRAMRLALADCAGNTLVAGRASKVTGLIVQISTPPEAPATPAEVAEALHLLQTELPATAVTPVVGLYPSENLPANGFRVRVLVCAAPDATIPPDQLRQALQQPAAPDTLVVEAAHLLLAQESTTGLFLQQQLGLGYHRAGRLLEELQRVGILGPPGPAGYPVLVADAPALERLLKRLNE